MINNGWNKIIQHDSLQRFPLPDTCIDVVITSPPYWGLRDYGVDGQIGLEIHPSEYIKHLVDVAMEIKRVLKKSGSFYLNLGDTYCGGGKNKPSQTIGKDKAYQYGGVQPNCDLDFDGKWLQPKQLMLIPMRVAIALQDDGWILRNDIIWHKPNPMPSSVKDRLNNTFEHVFHFVKSKRYYYDLDSIRELHKTESIKRACRGRHSDAINRINYNEDFTGYHNINERFEGGELRAVNAKGKNPGDVIEKNMKTEAEERGYTNHSTSRTLTHLHKIGKGYSKSDLGKNPGDTIESWNWRAGMNRDETEIIKIRINMPAQKEFVDYLKPKSMGFENKLDNIFTETKWRHWIRYDESGFAFPSVEDWKILKDILNLDDTFDLTQTKTKYNAVYSNPKGKMPGDFWNICTQPFTSYNADLEHFAVFPEELIIKPIKASCPKDGVVLDPFCGRGTVGKVARDFGLNYVLFDIKPEYCELARLYVSGQKRKLIKYQQKLGYDKT